MIDEYVIFHWVAVFLDQSSLYAGVYLHKDNFVHGEGHDPDIVAVVLVVHYVVGWFDRQLKANFREKLVFLLLLVEVEVNYLNKFMVFDQQVPTWIFAPISFLLHLADTLDYAPVHLILVFNMVLLPSPGNLEHIPLRWADLPFHFVVTLFGLEVPSWAPVVGFGGGVLIVGKGVDVFRIEEVPGEGIVVGTKTEDEEEGGDDKEEPDSDPI